MYLHSRYKVTWKQAYIGAPKQGNQKSKPSGDSKNHCSPTEAAVKSRQPLGFEATVRTGLSDSLYLLDLLYSSNTLAASSMCFTGACAKSTANVNLFQGILFKYCTSPWLLVDCGSDAKRLPTFDRNLRILQLRCTTVSRLEHMDKNLKVAF